MTTTNDLCVPSSLNNARVRGIHVNNSDVVVDKLSKVDHEGRATERVRNVLRVVGNRVRDHAFADLNETNQTDEHVVGTGEFADPNDTNQTGEHMVGTGEFADLNDTNQTETSGGHRRVR